MIINDKKSMLMHWGDTFRGIFHFYCEWRYPPRKIKAKSATVKKHLTVYKQPRARMGFLRGQRRNK